MEGKAIAYGAPLGKEGVASVEEQFGMDPKGQFRVNLDIYEFFEDVTVRGTKHESLFEQKLKRYEREYLEENFPQNQFLSREAAIVIFAALAKNLNTFMVGTANPREAVNMSWDGHIAFQDLKLKTICGLSSEYAGRYMHCGIREHAMVSIANGLAAFNGRIILSVTSGFLDYKLSILQPMTR